MRSHRMAALVDMLEIEKPWETTETVYEDPLGPYSIVRIGSQWDYGLETFFLAHCLGTKDFDSFEKAHRCYSVRDVLGIPHATILCRYADEWSEYGGAGDLGTSMPFTPKDTDRQLVVLQVRGRQDTLAMLPFHQLVRNWYIRSGGSEQVIDDKKLDYYCSRIDIADHDFLYHFQYKLDTSTNFFNWAYHNEKMRSQYQPT